MKRFLDNINEFVKEVYDMATVQGVEKDEVYARLIRALDEIWGAKRTILRAFEPNEYTGFALRELTRAEEKIIKIIDVLAVGEPTDKECPFCGRKMFYDKSKAMYVCPNCGMMMKADK